MEISPDALAQVADYFKVLSEVSRLQVLCCLKSGSKNVSDIMAATGLGQANVSKHLKILTQAGILSRNPSGVSVYYEIADPIIFELCELACDRAIHFLTSPVHCQTQERSGNQWQFCREKQSLVLPNEFEQYKPKRREHLRNRTYDMFSCVFARFTDI